MRKLIATRHPDHPPLPSHVQIGERDIAITKKDFDRFLSKISVQPDGRWTWTCKINRSGYGVFGLRRIDKTGSYIGAHRFAYTTLVGPIPEGLDLDHVRHNEAHLRGECEGGPSCLHRREVDPEGLVPRDRVSNVRLGVRRQGPVPDACPQGHKYTPENTYRDPKRGGRHCRTCARIRDRHRKERLREERLLAGAPTPSTTCVNGHAWDKANTYIRPNGKKNCRACQRQTEQAYRARKQAYVAARTRLLAGVAA
ncbi:hypothetical protein [Streptomyces sp. NPDC102437]|uniref:hypothetical protein n=1 Tax=Streptomyces sp. NPDC102437 TaxID=3366175 RepID=UPI00380AB8BE